MSDLSIKIEFELESDGDGGTRGVYEVYLAQWMPDPTHNWSGGHFKMTPIAKFYQLEDAQLFEQAVTFGKLHSFLKGGEPL